MECGWPKARDAGERSSAHQALGVPKVAHVKSDLVQSNDRVSLTNGKVDQERSHLAGNVRVSPGCALGLDTHRDQSPQSCGRIEHASPIHQPLTQSPGDNGQDDVIHRSHTRSVNLLKVFQGKFCSRESPLSTDACV